MTFDHIHREEAPSTDAGEDVTTLRAQAPPCTDCGRREAVADGYCEDCHPGDNTDETNGGS